MLRVGAEGDVRLGREDAVDLVEPVGDDVGDLLVLTDAHACDEVDLAGYGVDLADTLQLRDLLRDLWDARDVGLDRGTIVSHTANTHIIPATTYLRRAVRALSRGDDVRLEGWLVDVDGDDGFHWGTSTTRDDEGPNSCETVYLERLTVGERVYE